MQKINVNSVLTLVGLFAAMAGLSFWGQPPFDPDLGWHLFGGAYVASHHAAPSADLINTFSPRWHDYHWLAQWGMFVTYQKFGYQGLSLALGILGAIFALFLALIADRMQILRRSPLLTMLAIIAALLLIARVTSVRPQMISLCFLSAVLLLLKHKAHWLPNILLLLFSIIGANIHVYWIFIPLLYVIYRVVPALVAKNRVLFYQRSVFLILVSFSALISPYGMFHDSGGWLWENYALLFDYLVMPDAVSSTIGELQSAFSSSTQAALQICLFLMIGARGFRKSDIKTSLPDLLAALLGLILAIKATKFLAIFALLGFPYFIRSLYRASRPLRTVALKPSSVLSSSLLVAFLLLALVYTFYRFPNSSELEQQLAEHLPIEACQKIVSLPLTPSSPRQHVRILTHFNYGGWCRWIMHEKAPERDIRVTIDGRTQWFPPEFFTKGIDLYNARYDWLDTLKRWNPDVLLIQRDKPLASVLGLAQASWQLEYEDAGFVVFTPKRVP